MSRLLLVRHGQASFGSQNYDQLSELGRQQSLWLGEYFQRNQIRVDRLICGDLARQIQTAERLLEGMGTRIELTQDAAWNEFDFHQLGRRYLEQHPEATPKDASARAFFALLRQALLAWADNAVTGSLPETWETFHTRIGAAIDRACSRVNKHENVVVVSSGGAIAMAMQHVLGIPNAAVIDLNLQTRNTGLSDVYFNREQRYLTCFNAVPHLEQADRRACITSA